MSRRIIQLEDRTILFSPDDPVPFTGRLQALLKIRVVDELTGSPPEGRLTIEVSERSITPRVASGGIAGLVGIPLQVFPELNSKDYFVHLTIKAQGYVDRSEVVKVSQDPAYPASFTPPHLDLELHREPVVISGRTIRFVSNTPTALSGANVKVTGIWRTPPPSSAVVPADPPNLVSLRPPLYSRRTAGTGLLRSRNLMPVAGEDKLLLADALAGDNLIRLSNRQNLANGDILLIDTQQPDITEFLAIKLITGTGAADSPAYITLDNPVAFEHRRDAVLRKLSPQALGTIRDFTVDAMSRDTCVFLDDVIGFSAKQALITGGSAPDEHHKLMPFSVTSDADGYYRLPPIHRVANVEISAEGVVGGDTFRTPPNLTFRPDYNLRENRLDLSLKPVP